MRTRVLFASLLILSGCQTTTAKPAYVLKKTTLDPEFVYEPYSAALYVKPTVAAPIKVAETKPSVAAAKPPIPVVVASAPGATPVAKPGAVVTTKPAVTAAPPKPAPTLAPTWTAREGQTFRSALHTWSQLPPNPSDRWTVEFDPSYTADFPLKADVYFDGDFVDVVQRFVRLYEHAGNAPAIDIYRKQHVIFVTSKKASANE